MDMRKLKIEPAIKRVKMIDPEVRQNREVHKKPDNLKNLKIFKRYKEQNRFNRKGRKARCVE